MRVILDIGCYYFAFSTWIKERYWKFIFEPFALTGGYPRIEIQAGFFFFELNNEF
jgi:hypothetical protein